MPVAIIKQPNTKAAGPTDPKGAVYGLVSWRKPSPGKSNANGQAAVNCKPCTTSLRTKDRTNGPCISCGTGKLVSITDTVAAHT